MDGTKQIYLKLDHALEFRLIRTTEIYIFFFISEINDRKEMSKVLDKIQGS